MSNEYKRAICDRLDFLDTEIKFSQNRIKNAAIDNRSFDFIISEVKVLEKSKSQYALLRDVKSIAEMV